MAPPPESLILIAASGLAREALAVVRAHSLYNVVGFLDDSPDLDGAIVDGVPVLGSLAAATSNPDAMLVVCAGRGLVRQKIVTRLDALGVSRERYATISHPAIEIPEGCIIGAGSIILGGVILTTAVSIGEHVVIMPNVTVTHDCKLEDYATLCAGVSLGGNVIVGRAAYLGMNSSVRERAIVGVGSILGMGSMLLSDLPDGQTWIGAPARPLL